MQVGHMLKVHRQVILATKRLTGEKQQYHQREDHQRQEDDQ